MRWRWYHGCIYLLFFMSFVNSDESDSHSQSITAPSADACNNPETCYRYYHAQSSTNNRRSMLVVSTMDGKISALDLSNDCLENRMGWSLNPGMGPILSSTISKLDLLTDQGAVRLVPSLDGGLFTWDGKSVESVPYTADTLLSSSFRLSDDSIIVGAKESRVYGISSRTGELKYQCGSNGCQTYGDIVDENDDIIVIKRNQQTVKAVHSRTGNEKWNFSVGEHDLSYSEGLHVRGPCNENQDANTNCLESEKKEKMRSTGDSHVNFVISEGIVAVFNKQSKSSHHPSWTYKFPSAIAAAWKLDGDGVEAIDLFEDSNVPALSPDMPDQEEPLPVEDNLIPAIYMGMYKGQLYIQSSSKFTEAVAEAASNFAEDQQNNISGPRVVWRPYLASAPSRTPALVTSDPVDPSSDAALLTWNQYPFDTGYFLFADKTPLVVVNDQCKIDDDDDNDDDEDSEDIESSIIMETLEYIPVSIWTWWREILSISLIISVVMQLVISHLKHSINVHTGVVSVDQLSQSSHSSSVVAVAEEAASLPTLPQEYMAEYQIPTQPKFQSRYLEDFEQEAFLGKGGFGMVFQARNKLDDHVYAIKRITLPNREEARKRVMREVTALADLEHTGIVRYYNAWMEAPPPGWQEERDKTMLQNLSGSLTPTRGHSLSPNETNLNLVLEKLEKSGQVVKEETGCHHGEGDFTTSNDSWIQFSDDHEELPQQKQRPFNPFTESRQYESDTEESSGRPVTVPFQNMRPLGQDDVLADLSFGAGQLRRQDSAASDSFIIFKEGGEEEAGEAAANVESSKGFDVFNNSESCRTPNEHTTPPQPRVPQRSNSSGDQPMPKAYLYIQMQLCQKESLKDWLNVTVEGREQHQVLDIFSQILNAVQYIHERTLIHRDLKPSNIFFLGDGTVKVGDFGLVTEMNSAQEEEEADPQDGNLAKKHTGLVGTKLYMSPEQIYGKTYNHKVDIFSLGVILFELMNPFSTQMERVKTLSDIKMQKFPKEFLLRAEGKLVQWLLAAEPDQRPDTNEITESQLFKHVFKDYVPTTSLSERRRQSSVNLSNTSL